MKLQEIIDLRKAIARSQLEYWQGKITREHQMWGLTRSLQIIWWEMVARTGVAA
jgi:hypothetical protein